MGAHATDVATRQGPPAERRQTVDSAVTGRDAVAYLVVIQHPSREMLARRFRIRPGERLTIGRDPKREVCLDEATVSRLHTELVFRKGQGVFARDVRSVNGTFRNEEPLGCDDTLLDHGDLLAVGPSVRLKFLQTPDEELAYHEEIARLVHCDSLTGAARAGSFLERLEREVQRAQRYGRDLSLILFDVDEFKQINDTWGHAAGDAALVAVVRSCTDEVRAEETVGRLGGDEFAILCPETAAEPARLLAERLCSRISAHPVHLTMPASPIPLTCSWGVAALGPDVPTATDLRKAADEALYRAKKLGRNRVAG